MAKVVISPNLTCQLQQETDFSFLSELDLELSFKVQGAEYSRAYKGYVTPDGHFVKWDGRKHLLTSSLTFPYGLLSRVLEAYSDRNRPLEIVDSRQKSSIQSIEIIPKLTSLGKSPFPYQLDVLKSVSENDCGIIRVGTGGGKSVIAALMTAFFGKRTIIYVIGVDLLHQFHRLFSDIFEGQKIGIVGDGLCEISDINIVSVWTAGEALGLKKSEILLDGDAEVCLKTEQKKQVLRLLKEARVHILDECHLAACDTIQEIARTIQPEHIYGMSASPWRDDGADLLIEGLLGRRIVDISASWLIRNKYLVRPYIQFASVPPLSQPVKKSYPTIYKNYIVQNQIRNGMVVKTAASMIEAGYKPLILYEKLEHGRLLEAELGRFSRVLLSGKDSIERRQEAGQMLLNGKAQVLLASTIFDIGVDLPFVNALIPAGGGKGSVRCLQRIGRAIRAFPGKEFCQVVDFWDKIHYLTSHSQQRFHIYSSEEEFSVKCPQQINQPSRFLKR